MALKITGLTKVKTLKANFKKEFGLTIRVYDGRSFADDNATLASIRKNDNKGGELSPKRNMKVGNLEDKIMDLFGIKTQIAGSDDSYLCDNDHTLAKALEVDEKKIAKKEVKNNKSVEDTNIMEENDEEKIFSALFEWADKFDIDSEWFPRDINELKILTKLELTDENLIELPKEIGHLTSLIELELGSNKLTELPKEIGNLTSLRNLDLSRNKLTELPKEIGHLISLTEFDLNENQLIQLPKEIGNLTSLTELGLNQNQLTQLPKEIGNLTSLTELNLSINQLIALPKEIGNLTSIPKLLLARNQLKQLPEEIGNLRSLTELDLMNNQLTQLPKEIGNLRSLTELNLSDNQLTQLPKEIGNLTSLTELNLTENQLTELPKEIGNLISLTELALKDNQLIELPKEIEKLSIENLYVDEVISTNNNEETDTSSSIASFFDTDAMDEEFNNLAKQFSISNTDDTFEAGKAILTAVSAITKWLRLEKALTHIEVHRQAMFFARNQLGTQYDLSIDDMHSLNDKGIALAVKYFEEGKESNYRGFIKELDAYHLDAEDLGTLAIQLLMYGRICREYEPKEISDKYMTDIIATLEHQFDCADIIEETKIMVEESFAEVKDTLMNHQPI